MFRFSTIAFATVLAVASFASTAADARGRGPGGPGGHISRGPSGVRTFSAAPRFSAPRFSAAPRMVGPRGFTGPRVRTYRGYPYRFGYRPRYRFIAPYGYYAYNGCYRWRRVWTAYGPRLVRVNVCVPYYRPYGFPFVY